MILDPASKSKIIVLDDDPTGSQTVHGCLLLTQWDPDTLALGLRDPSPIFFVLTNTRALSPEEAAERTREVCRSLKVAIEKVGVTEWILVSRSDSTLRGHYPVETDVITAELGPFDAHFLIPAFFEGGRVTRESVHYLRVGQDWVPVHETEFARDSVFGYGHSYLPDYVAEKTGGRIPAEDVVRLTLKEIRDPQGLRQQLEGLKGDRCCVVDGEVQSDLDGFAVQLRTVAATGKRFLLRSAASVLTSLAGLPPQPLAPDQMSLGSGPGLVMVGSHVQKSTEQLQRLLEEPDVAGIEVKIGRLLQDPQVDLLGEVLEKVEEVCRQGLTPVVYTSRQELTFDNVETRLRFGQEVSDLLVAIERGIQFPIQFLISKGGITSNDTVSKGLAVPAIRLLGQVAAGVSVVQAPENHPQFPGIPVVLFPGNVGDRETLAQVFRLLHSA